MSASKANSNLQQHGFLRAMFAAESALNKLDRMEREIAILEDRQAEIRSLIAIKRSTIDSLKGIENGS